MFMYILNHKYFSTCIIYICLYYMFFAAAIYIHEQAYRFIQTFCKKYFATGFFTLSKTKYILPKIVSLRGNQKCITCINVVCFFIPLLYFNCLFFIRQNVITDQITFCKLKKASKTVFCFVRDYTELYNIKIFYSVS